MDKFSGYLKVFNKVYAFMNKYYINELRQELVDGILNRIENRFESDLIKAVTGELKRAYADTRDSESFKDRYYEIFKDIYTLMRKYYGAKTHEEWCELVSEVNQIDRKYGDNRLVTDLLVAVNIELLRVYYADGCKDDKRSPSQG